MNRVGGREKFQCGVGLFINMGTDMDMVMGIGPDAALACVGTDMGFLLYYTILLRDNDECITKF